MRRRDFLALAAASAAMLPLPALVRAQVLSPGMKRLGFAFPLTADDPQTPKYVDPMRAALSKQGWVEGKNLTIDYRFGALAATAMSAAQELFDLHPDAFLVWGPSAVAALAAITKTIPISFAGVNAAALGPFVADRAHPMGNITGFGGNEDTVPGKWLDLLRDLSPTVTRAGFLLSPERTSAPQIQFPAFSAAGRSAGIEVVPIQVPGVPWTDTTNVATALTAFAEKPNSGVVISSGFVNGDRPFLYAEVAKLRLPAVWGHLIFGWEGVPVAYATDNPGILAGAADYAGRILNGTKVADLPAQYPTLYRLMINLKTAKDQNLTIPPTLLARADDVIG